MLATHTQSSIPYTYPIRTRQNPTTALTKILKTTNPTESLQRPYTKKPKNPDVTGHLSKDVGSCQNYGPFLGALNIRCRIILRTQKGTIILTTTHVLELSRSCASRQARSDHEADAVLPLVLLFILFWLGFRVWGLGGVCVCVYVCIHIYIYLFVYIFISVCMDGFVLFKGRGAICFTGFRRELEGTREVWGLGELEMS